MHWHNLVTFVQVWSIIDIICEIHVFQYHFQVRLSSKSPWDPPLVDPCYLCDQSDSELLVKAIQQTVDMVNGSSELKRLLSGIFLLLFKGVLSINFIFSLWYIYCYILETNELFLKGMVSSYRTCIGLDVKNTSFFLLSTGPVICHTWAIFFNICELKK